MVLLNRDDAQAVRVLGSNVHGQAQTVHGQLLHQTHGERVQ